jgi:hypothetical protein
VPDEQLVDDGGLSSEFIFVEAAPDEISITPQALWVRVGPVFYSDKAETEVGVWIMYQEGYMKADLMGPVLLSPQAWRKLNATVEERLQAKGVMPSADGPE